MQENRTSENDPPSPSRLFLPARWTQLYLASRGLLWILDWARGASALLLAGISFSASAVGWPKTMLPFWAAAAVQVVVWYLGSGQAKALEVAHRRLDSLQAETKEEVFLLVAELQASAAGNLQEVLRLVVEHYGRRLRAATFKEKLRMLRSAVLQHIVEWASKRIGASSGELSANWMFVEQIGEQRQLRLECFDRFHFGRPATRRVSLERSTPGAAEACLTGEPFLVSDTQAPGFVEHFGEERPYRTILSIPVQVFVDSAKKETIGVVNLDSPTPHCFDLSLVTHLLDESYVIGLTWLLGEGRKKKDQA